MPVSTPQLDEPVFGGGIATQQSAAAATPEMPTGSTPQALPPGAGFVPKSGAAAYVANGIIDGWLKGRQIAAVRNMQQAQNNLNSLYQSYKNDAAAYQNLAVDPNADQKKVAEARQVAVDSWNRYNQGRAQYIIPDKTNGGKGGKGKDGGQSAGEKFKGALGGWASQMFGKGGVQPHMFAEMAVKMAENKPEGLEPSPQQKLEMQLNQERLLQSQIETKEAQARLPGEEATSDLQVVEAKLKKQNIQDDEEFKRLSGLENPTVVERARLQQLQKQSDAEIGLKDPEKLILLQAVRALNSQGQPGAIPLTASQRSVLRANNLLPKLHIETTQQGNKQLRQLMDDEGNVIRNLPSGWSTSQVAEANAIADHKNNQLYDEIAMAMDIPLTKDRKDPRVWKAVLGENGRNSRWLDEVFSGDPHAQMLRMQKLDKALLLVYRNSTPEQQAVMQNFVTGDPAKGNKDAFLSWRPQIQPPQGKTGWFGFGQNKYSGGLKEDDVAATRQTFVQRTREALAASGMLPQEIDRTLQENGMMPTPNDGSGTSPDTAQRGQVPGQSQGTQPGNQQIPNPPRNLAGAIGRSVSEEPEVQLAGSALRGIEYLFSRDPAAPNNITVKGPDGFYGTKSKDTKEYRVRLKSGPDKGWAKFHLTEDDAKALQSESYEVVPIEMTGTGIN